MTRICAIALMCVMVACGKTERTRTGPIKLESRVTNYTRDTACKPERIALEIKSEPGVTVRVAAVSGTTGDDGVWVANVPAAALEGMWNAGKKRVAITASKGKRTGASSHSLHLIGARVGVRRYPKGLDELPVSDRAWDSAYLACRPREVSASVGKASVVKQRLIHWSVPYDVLGPLVPLGKTAADQPPQVPAELRVVDGRGKTHRVSTRVPLSAKRFADFLGALAAQAGKPNPRAPAYRPGKGPHPLVYFRKGAPADTSLALGVPASRVVLLATATDKYQLRGTCTYRVGNNRQQVALLQVDPTITVYAARTGKRIASKRFVGLPPACKKVMTSTRDQGASAPSALDSVLGLVPEAKIKAWLRKLAR